MLAMSRLRVMVLTVLTLGLSGCGNLESAPPSPGGEPTPHAEAPPPEVLANDVAGFVTGWCRANYCADGGVELADGSQPPIRTPVRFTFAEPVTYMTAHVSSAGRDDIPVPLSGVNADGRVVGDVAITSLPAGEWLSIYVGFRSDPWGDASYAWVLRPPADQ